MLKVFSKLASDIINKSLRISKIFLEKDLELWPYKKSDVLIAVLMLGLSKVDSTTEK